MNTDWINMLVRRFAKGFAAGFVSALILFVAQNPTISVVSWKPWIISAITAAITGGLLAVEKMIQGYNPQ